MHMKDVKIGAVYAVKVSGLVVPVKITNDLGYSSPGRFTRIGRKVGRHRGWEGINQRSGRKVHIRSAARLRQEVQVEPVYKEKGHVAKSGQSVSAEGAD